MELIDAAYYQVDLFELSPRKFFNLIYAWLYDSMTMVNRGRVMDHWDEKWAPIFADVSAGGSADDMDPARAREDLGIKPAVPGQRGDVKIVSKMPKMSWRELQEWKEYSTKDPEMLERLDGLDRQDRVPILEEWLEQQRADQDSAADS